ncbi:carboxypeptidase-like regulatory domain-containing protein [Porphyromonas levii]|uniref:carboxypeptidase-like regulatory domain-containing protein n=1 Tax=Porphyromonas levii TaxID=28114 RepID=UPI001B8C5FEB|nr:carboxypeptidase-like regulatory domain-containing protein [Porphyromonas levii]
MKRIFFLLLLTCIFDSLLVFGQTEGRVISKEGSDILSGVIVVAKRAGEKKVLSYSRTNNDGNFKLNINPTSGVWLYFSMLGYAKDSLELTEGQSYYEIKLREQVTELQEVKVTAKAITARGDTIRYLVSNFSEIQDKNLADVLKKMPGIEVSESGQIKYQGQAINKFYIEGRDMLGGRYGIATNTINPDDVGSVEVMENHQPIKALEDISFSQNPAINIRLKEDAKSRWVGTATLGGGYMDTKPALLWDGQATLMRFKKENQVLITGRSTNAGKSASTFSSNLIFDNDGSPFGGEYSLSNPIGVSPSVPYQLALNRTRKGPSHMVSTNNLWGLGKHIDLTSKVNYSHQTDLSSSRSEMIYFLNDGNRVIESQEQSEARDKNLSVDVNLLVNRPKLYLSNKLSGNFEWNNVELLTAGTYPNVQAVKGERQGVENRLNVLVRRGRGGFSLNSFVKWERRPNVLEVESETQHPTLRQTLASQLLFTNTSTSLSYILGRVVLSTKLGLATMHRSMESHLSGLELSLSPLENDVRANYYQLYATPQLSYSYKNFKSEIEAPIAWTPYSIESGKTTRLHRFPLSPRIRLELQATTRLKLSASVRYRNEILDDQEWYDGYILNNYRTLSLGLEELGNRESGYASFSANYRNALEALFASASVSYNRFRTSHLSSRDFVDRYMVLQPIARESRGDRWTLNGRVSKGFMWLRSVLTFNALYSLGNQELLLQKELTPYRYDMLILSGQISMRPATWATLLYEISYNQSGQEGEGQGFERRNNYAQRLDLTFVPSKSWRVELTGNHYYNEITENVRKHYLLADASLVYSAPAGWEVNLTARNLFNNRTYGYTSLSALTSYTLEYQIRPLELLLGFYFRF